MVSSFTIWQYNSTSVICLNTVFSIWFIDRTLSDGTTPGQSGPRSNGSEGSLHIPQISKAGASPSEGLMSYPYAEMQLVYSIALVNWVLGVWVMWDTLRFTLTQSWSTCKGPIDGSKWNVHVFGKGLLLSLLLIWNITAVWKLFTLNWNAW